MKSRLHRRLERLEEQTVPERVESLRIEVFYYTPDGSASLGYVVEIPRDRLLSAFPGSGRSRSPRR
jgi:hypothetical protein